jgi:hypothetical protein
MLRLAAFISLAVSVAASLVAQTQASGTLTGKLTDASGAVVANATVTATNIDTGQTRTATGADGAYQFTMLPAGNYRVRFEAQGFKALEIASAAIGAEQAVVNGRLEPGASTPLLGDLGFTPDQSQGSAQDQARLDRRSHMLKIHQRLGLITTAPLVATLFAANGAAGHKSTASGRDLHAILGGVTAGMYLTTASFAIFAPKVAGTPTRGSIRVHKALAWIHGPGMILTPILGSLALQQRNNGEKVHGIASAHGAVAAVTSVAYGAAMLSVMIKF